MLWVQSKNAKRRLEAIVEAMDENIEKKMIVSVRKLLQLIRN